ncbi:amidase family protein [Phenylobacterium sp.]|uniref:amidase family protein n=1 Tax=Phenylobacterium sp. TaxID=1871053 RepID=UPI0025D4A7BF|nr:amidase family protein [Phenylobacterium sp.]MCA3721833.1 amidase [Phenylobacterium sp.]
MSQDLTQASAAELSGLYAARKASPVEALEAVLDRVARLNPVLNALPLIDADSARAQARASEARWAKGEPLSPIDGVPTSVKELIKVKGWPLTMASKLTDKAPQTEDATTVSRLREAGCVLFATNSSPEYGFKGVTDSPLNGITRNPWNTERTPGGSSGGAGAAVAAGFGPLSIGTDGGGSVRIPAACTGLVGLKATYGRIPAWPASMHGDLANTGPMTRTTRDAALMLNVLKGADVRDPQALPPTDVDFVAGLDRSLKGLKVGLVLKFGDFFLDPEVEAAVLKAAERFRALGCEVVPITPPTENGETGQVFVSHWFAALQRLLQLYPEARHNEFDPALYDQAKIGAKLDVKTIIDSQVRRLEMAHAWNQVFADYDLVLSPTMSTLPPQVGRNVPDGPDGRPNPYWTNTAIFNLTRHPAVSVPCGISSIGTPFGLQIAAAHSRDDLVLAAAEAFERQDPLAFPRM